MRGPGITTGSLDVSTPALGSALSENDFFRPLLTYLRPDGAEVGAAEAAANEVGRRLDARFADDRAGDTSSAGGLLVVGGIAKGTATSARIIDCLYVLPQRIRHCAWRKRGGPGNGDIELIGNLVATLSRSSASAHLTPAGWIAVETLSGSIVRLMPAIPLESGGFRLARPVDGIGVWHATDPAAELDALQRANCISRGKATHLMLLLKCWRRANEVAIHSVALERLAIEFVPQWPYRRRSLLFYDWMVRDFFFWAAHQGGRRVNLPGTNQTFDLGTQWVFQAEAAFAFAKRAGRLGSLGRWDAAAEHWCRIFGQSLEMVLGETPSPAAGIAADGTEPPSISGYRAPVT